MKKYNLKTPASPCQVSGLADIYMEHIGYKSDGTFVEIGAYDGISWSNTFGLLVSGWKGVYFEPVPEYFARCTRNLEQFKNKIIINEAVGSYEGDVELFLGEAITTTKESIVDDYNNVDYFKGILNKDRKITSKINTLNNQLEKLKLESIDVMSIDVEGAEIDVLNGFDIQKWRPTLVIIEMNEEDENEILHKGNDVINEYFFKNNYEKIYKDKINTIFKIKK